MDHIERRAKAARRLKSDSAFQEFIEDVRNAQLESFAASAASEIEAREEAHAILRALNQIEMSLDAAIAAERLAQS